MYDVVIVGGGPVGMGLAIELGQRNISVCVIERHETLQPVPKGQNLTQRTMEHMQVWGVEDAIRAAKLIPKGVGLGGLTAYGNLLSGYHYDWFKRATVAQFYGADNERLPQYATEKVLRARVAELSSVTVMYGETGVDVTNEADRVKVTLESGTAVAGRFAVGCDGSDSCVRDAVAITETRRDHNVPMALLVFRSPELFELLNRFPDKQFYNVLHPDLDGYWMFFGMVDWGQTFFFHAPIPPGTDRDNFDFRGYLHRAVGKEFSLDLEYVGFWDLRTAYANTYRKDRVFVAGDAAHSHPPYGGYGINTGFEDARNLGWKLAAHLNAQGSERLLNSYDSERRPVFESTARDFIETFISEDRAFVRAHDPVRDASDFEGAWAKRSMGGESAGISGFAPHYCGSQILPNMPGEPSAVGDHQITARAGHHLSPQLLSNGRKVYDCLGLDFTLLALGTDASGFQSAARSLGVGLRIVIDQDGPARQNYGAALVLIRPDGFVAWTGDVCADPEVLLRRVAGL